MYSKGYINTMKNIFKEESCLGEDYIVTKKSLSLACPIRDKCKRHIYRQSKYIYFCLVDNQYDHNKKECNYFIKGE